MYCNKINNFVKCLVVGSLALICGFCLIACSGQNIEKITGEQTLTENLIDKDIQIKRDIVQECEYDDQGKLIKIIFTGQNYFKDHYVMHEYGSSGNEIKNIKYDLDGKLIGWSDYEYNKQVNGIIKLSYDSEGNYTFRIERLYDDYENLICEKQFDSERECVWWQEWKYDDLGNMKESKVCNPDGSTERTVEYLYDKSGNVTNVIYWDAEGKLNRWDEYVYEDKSVYIYSYTTQGLVFYDKEEYDEKDQKIKCSTFSKNNKIDFEDLMRYEIWEYDKYGNEIKHIRFDENGEIDSWFEYEYDIKGNCIRTFECEYLTTE